MLDCVSRSGKAAIVINDALMMAPKPPGARTGICESVIGRLAMNRFEQLSSNGSSANLWPQLCAESNTAEAWAKLYYPACADPDFERTFAICAEPQRTAHEFAVLEYSASVHGIGARLKTEQEKEQYKLLSRKSSVGASGQSET